MGCHSIKNSKLLFVKNNENKNKTKLQRQLNQKIAYKLTLEILNGHSLGFPLRLYLINWEPFFNAISAFKI